MLEDFAYLLTETDLTKVHWAQFLDSGKGNFSGMVSIEGHPKAVFNGYEIYSRLPIDRMELTVSDGSAINGLAGSDGRRAGAVLWNKSTEPVDVSVLFSNLPDQREVLVYRVDGEHSSWGDCTENFTLEPVETLELNGSDRFVWAGQIPGKGVVYLEFGQPDYVSVPTTLLPGQVVRPLYYFPRRGGTSYAEFDPFNWTAYLGTGSKDSGEARVGCVVENLAEKLHVDVSLNDGSSVTGSSYIGLRVDYQGKEGYQKTVFYQVAGEDQVELDHSPWGLQASIDRVYRVGAAKGFEVELSPDAPKDWTGRIILSFVMIEDGPNGQAQFAIQKANE
jgi:hypothetical protein